MILESKTLLIVPTGELKSSYPTQIVLNVKMLCPGGLKMCLTHHLKNLSDLHSCSLVHQEPFTLTPAHGRLQLQRQFWAQCLAQ